MFGVRYYNVGKSLPLILKDLTSSLCTSVKRTTPPLAAESREGAFAPEQLLSAAARKRCVSTLQRLQPVRVDGDAAPRKAAVLVPLCEVDGAVSLLYTLRAATLASYRGQVAFPGGMMDASDGGSLETAALREAREELGVEASRVCVWGAGPWVGTARRDAVVRPIVGSLGAVDVAALTLSKQEVECAFAVPLHRLCDPKHFRYTRFRNSYAIPVFTAGQYRIWGITAIITHMLLKALLPSVYTQTLPKVEHSLLI